MEHLLSHLTAAYNLARWLTRNGTDAEDVVQEAYLRAFKHFRSFRGSDSRPWLLAIVRNTFYTWLRQNRAPELQIPFDEEIQIADEDHLDPEAQLLQKANTHLVRQAIEELPPEFREVIVLRELEGLSYRQIADVTDTPVGTVMSRLARGRKRLVQSLSELREQGKTPSNLVPRAASSDEKSSTLACLSRRSPLAGSPIAKSGSTQEGSGQEYAQWMCP